MSFSFNVKAASRKEAYGMVEAELHKVCDLQPVHEKDAPSIAAMVREYLEIADEPAEGAQINMNVAGSIWFGHEGKLGGVTASFQLSYIAAPKPSTIGDSDGDDGA